jgi:hypothetical protein
MIKLRGRPLTQIAKRFAVIGAASTILVGGIATAASAAVPAGTSLAQPQADSVMVTQPMHIVRFDAAVAKAHGYDVRTDAQGQQYAVPTGTKSGAFVEAVPYNRVTGNCGASWMYYNAIGHRATKPRYMANFNSGYQVSRPTIAGHWLMYFQDRAGIGLITKLGATHGTAYWNDAETTYHSLTGASQAWVSTDSWVMLNNGAICTSGGPSASTVLY